MVEYTPDRGHIVWLNFNPQAGREQAGHRPALVLSPFVYNQASELMIACPITSTSKGYAFEVQLPSYSKVQGVVLADQAKSISWKARQARFHSTADPEIINNVLGKLFAILNT